MDDRRHLHRSALELADDVVAAVRPADLGRATPCAGWNLGDLLAHMVGQHIGFAQAVRCGTAPHSAYAPVPFGHDAWRASVVELVAAFGAADLDASAVEIELALVPLPMRRLLDAQLIDTVVHTWDVAQALGREFTPPQQVLAAAAEIAAGLPAQAYGPGAAFARRLADTGDVWSDTLARVGRRHGSPGR